MIREVPNEQELEDDIGDLEARGVTAIAGVPFERLLEIVKNSPAFHEVALARGLITLKAELMRISRRVARDNGLLAALDDDDQVFYLIGKRQQEYGCGITDDELEEFFCRGQGWTEERLRAALSELEALEFAGKKTASQA